jgi:Fic family protein
MISIHPFGDGNGRTSRGVESYVLYRSGINSLGFYSLANFYYVNRNEYVELLDRARFVHDADLTEFATFAMGGLRDELELVHGEALQVLKEIAFRDYARETLQADSGLRTKTSERRLQLVQLILREPASLMSLRSGRALASALYIDVTPKTLTRDLNYLTRDANLLVIEDGQVRANLDAMNQSMDEQT